MKHRTLIAAGLLIALIASNSTLAFATNNDKKTEKDNSTWVFVCKYVGTPHINEHLKKGKQPIRIKSSATVGTWFNDAQGRSYILDASTKGNTGKGNIYVGEKSCPSVTPPIPVLKAVLSASVVCDEATGNLKITLSNSGNIQGTAIVDGDPVVVTAGGSVTRTSAKNAVIARYDNTDHILTTPCEAPGKGNTGTPGGTTDNGNSTPTTPPAIPGQGTSAPVTTPVAPAAVAAPAAPMQTAVTKLPYTAGISPLAVIAAIASMGAIFTTISFSAKALYRRIS